MYKRDFSSPEYKRWRLSVYKRDGFRCRYPNCCVKKGLQAHHIKLWARYPDLRFVLSNGITLCKRHHKMIWGKEEQYEEMFLTIVSPTSLDIKVLMYKLRRENVR